MDRKLIVPGGILWLAGIALSIIGMNIHTNTGSLLAIVGNILFLVGLGIVGVAWIAERKRNGGNREE
jgi:hypothetical protein